MAGRHPTDYAAQNGQGFRREMGRQHLVITTDDISRRVSYPQGCHQREGHGDTGISPMELFDAGVYYFDPAYLSEPYIRE